MVKFFDLRDRKSFETNKFTTFTRQVRGRTVTFAKATAPSGAKSTRILSNRR